MQPSIAAAYANRPDSARRTGTRCSAAVAAHVWDVLADADASHGRCRSDLPRWIEPLQAGWAIGRDVAPVLSNHAAIIGIRDIALKVPTGRADVVDGRRVLGEEATRDHERGCPLICCTTILIRIHRRGLTIRTDTVR